MLSPWTAHATSYPAVRKGIRQAVIAASDRRFLFDSGGDGPAGVEVHTVAYLTKPRRRGGGRRRSGGAAVFVDEPAEHIDPLDRPDRLHARGCVAHRCNGHVEVDAAMWTGGVVVPDVVGQHSFEVTVVPDQNPVEALAAHGAYPALGVGVRFRRLRWSLEHVDAGGGEDGVERRRA